MEYEIKINKKSISIKYEQGTIYKRFPKTPTPYHNQNLAKGDVTLKGNFRKLLEKKWLDEVIAQVTSDCYNAIKNSAPKRTGQYRDHIVMKSPAANKYIGDELKHIKYGTIYIKDGPIPDGTANYSDLARFLEFGTRSFEVTGAGKPATTKEGEPWGTHPQPHWIPNFEIYKRVLKQKIKEALGKV